MPARDRLRSGRLRAGVGALTIGREIVVVEETASTNDLVLQMADGDWPEGLVVFAEHQTGGRGQRGNKWESSAHKGLWFSILLRPGIKIADSPRLTRWAAQTIAATIQSECFLEATVKPPNDVYVAGRKLAGVLLEMRAQPRAPHVAILGIGLNVNQGPGDFSQDLRKRATSLAILQRRRLDRHMLAVALLRNLDRTYGDALGE